MFFHNAGANRQPKSCPACIPLCRVKRIKNIVHVFSGNPNSLVLDTHYDLTVFLIIKRPDFDAPITSWKGLTGILNEIDNHLLETLEISPNRRKIFTVVHGKGVG